MVVHEEIQYQLKNVLWLYGLNAFKFVYIALVDAVGGSSKRPVERQLVCGGFHRHFESPIQVYVELVHTRYT